MPSSQGYTVGLLHASGRPPFSWPLSKQAFLDDGKNVSEEAVGRTMPPLRQALSRLERRGTEVRTVVVGRV
jgi:hypothetical protein